MACFISMVLCINRRHETKIETFTHTTTTIIIIMMEQRQILSFPRCGVEEFAIDALDYSVLEEIYLDQGYPSEKLWQTVKNSVEVQEEGRRVQAIHRVGNVEELPPSIGNLSGLIKLKLRYRKYRSLPPSIGQLKNLQELHLEALDELSSLPKEIGNLSSLIKLHLSDVGIRSLPSSIGQLQSLQELYLDGNEQLSILPEEIGNLSNLIKLTIWQSAYNSLPPSIGKLKNLQELDLDNITSLPEEMPTSIQHYVASSFDLSIAKSTGTSSTSHKTAE